MQQTNLTIDLITRDSGLVEAGVNYFWKCWGSDSNFDFYRDCIVHSLVPEVALPKFYLLRRGSEIVGSYALLTNDLISRQDLLPWFACLFVEEAHRNQGLAGKLLDHALLEARKGGFDHLYLSTDLKGFYEKKGWDFYALGYGVGGDPFSIYVRST
ncbi:MAG: GNAT family N-acetyltransferase [Bacteroidota bacterium]